MLLLAAETLREYRRSRSLIRALRSALKKSALPDPEKGLLSRLLLDPGQSPGSQTKSKEVAELAFIVASCMETGSSAEAPLKLFIKRLEQEISLENKLKSKTGSMQTLTYLGVSVFFPMFSGIVAAILNSGVGLAGPGFPTARFQALCFTYVLVTLFLSQAFAHPERQAAGNLLSIIPFAFVALAVMYLTRNYLFYVV